jgi:hypothetical protein
MSWELIFLFVIVTLLSAGYILLTSLIQSLTKMLKEICLWIDEQEKKNESTR